MNCIQRKKLTVAEQKAIQKVVDREVAERIAIACGLSACAEADKRKREVFERFRPEFEGLLQEMGVEGI